MCPLLMESIRAPNFEVRPKWFSKDAEGNIPIGIAVATRYVKIILPLNISDRGDQWTRIRVSLFVPE